MLLLQGVFSSTSVQRVLITYSCTELLTYWIAPCVFESNNVVEEVLWVRASDHDITPVDWV